MPGVAEIEEEVESREFVDGCGHGVASTQCWRHVPGLFDAPRAQPKADRREAVAVRFIFQEVLCLGLYPALPPSTPRGTVGSVTWRQGEDVRRAGLANGTKNLRADLSPAVRGTFFRFVRKRLFLLSLVPFKLNPLPSYLKLFFVL